MICKLGIMLMILTTVMYADAIWLHLLKKKEGGAAIA